MLRRSDILSTAPLEGADLPAPALSMPVPPPFPLSFASPPRAPSRSPGWQAHLSPLPSPVRIDSAPWADSQAPSADAAAPFPAATASTPSEPLLFEKKPVGGVPRVEARPSALSCMNLGLVPPTEAEEAQGFPSPNKEASSSGANPGAASPAATADALGFQEAVSVVAIGNAKKPMPSDFTVLDEVGSGAFGIVLRVKHNASGQIMAMKIIEKSAVVSRGSGSKYVQSEKDLMRQIEHPFIVRLKCSMQSKSRLFLIMEFVAGGELFEHIRNEGLFSEPVAAFYAAEILLALEYLHQHKIVHRDLKPENVLLDEAGHLRLTDFGLAAAIPDGGTGLKSIVGSPAYMAPEMLAGKPYGPAVDYWALGTLIFEMLTGDPPFGNKDSKKRLIQRILNENPKFPPYLSAPCIKLLRGLLDRNVERRLGAAKSSMFEVRGVAEVKASPFFANLDWESLLDRELEAPFRPQIAPVLPPVKVSPVNAAVAYGQSMQSPAGVDKGLFDGFSYVAPGFV